MGIHFSHPEYLLLLPFAWAFTWWMARHSLADLERIRRRLTTIFRLVLFTGIICALAGMQLVRPTDSLCVIFAVDVSDSIDPQERAGILDYIHQAVQKKRSRDSAALVAFGAEALLDHAPEDRRTISKIISLPSTTRTNIAAGIQLAMASFPPESGKHIILFTDGNENEGNSLEQADLATQQDVRISVVPLQRIVDRNEVLLLGANTPAEAHQGAPFLVSVIAQALQATDASVTLLRDNQPVGTKQVKLKAGKNAISFTQTVADAGVHHFHAVLDVPAAQDSVPDNNVADAYIRIKGKPKVLIVESESGEGANLARALRANDLQVELGGAERIPRTLAECAEYESLVFANVPAWKMSPAQMAVIHSAVHDAGMGFAMIGGDSSFGAGGYLHTPIEKALPVEMTPKQKQFPTLTLVIVIDISGSMTMPEDGVPKIRLAAEAASAAVDLLQPIDYINVMGFDTGPIDTVPMTRADDKSRIRQQISRLEAGGGGIVAYPALEAAYQAIKGAKTKIKHIILCADAQDTERQEGCIALAEDMRREKITLSVIGFGQQTDPHVEFHRQLAAAGGGQSYLAEKLNQLPVIFNTDVLNSQGTQLLAEEPFHPAFTAVAQPDLRNIDWRSAPSLLGYVRTTMKTAPGAKQLLASRKKEPVLATWTYGLGRTLAFTSDATAHWGAHWLSWPEYATFWAQALRWTLRQQSNLANFRVQVMEEHGQGSIVVEAVTPEGEFRNLLDFRAHVAHVSSGGIDGVQSTSDVLQLHQTAPGRYEASFPIRDLGVYQVTVEERQEERMAGIQTASLVIPYSPEYQSLQPNLPLLHRITEQAHGVLQPQAEALYRSMRWQSRVLRDLWHGVIVLFCLLFLLDVAIRRILLPWQEFQDMVMASIRRLIPERRVLATAMPARRLSRVSNLLTAKDKAREQQESATLITTRLREARQSTRKETAKLPSGAPASPGKATDMPASMTGTLLQKKRERSGKPSE